MSDRKSIEQVVYDLLKNAILNRKILPGKQLIENTIADKLNISRTPIRNAIKKLEAEGLVNSIPNRGAFVIQPTLEEMIEAFEIRKELELIAVKYGLSHVKNEDITQLKQLIEIGREAYNRQDISKYLSINTEFHLFLARKGNNRFLCEFLETLFNQINVYLLLYDVYHYSRLESDNIYTEHKKMIELMEQKDEKLLLEFLNQHLDTSLQDLKIDKMQYQPLEDIF
ncbi:GntR family transcriptional regulator [Ectobacillus panaciterrae]|uniref:GntR family transcriptional regulator n=1 Tax=Ectobacillus panaciterrae TaxID=363872 RepID=UPI000492102F|nr:GntR family transcriptional regulator [Ectobacillus panaciterrae]